MSNNLETTIEHAKKITLGQIDNGTLATAVNCADIIAIARHGRVESYVIPKHLIDELLLKVAVVECDNKRLLGERVAESIPVPKSHFFNHDFKIDMNAVTSCDMPAGRYFHDFRHDRKAIDKAIDKIGRAAARMSKPEQTPYCRYCLDPNCQRDEHCLFDRHLARARNAVIMGARRMPVKNHDRSKL